MKREEYLQILTDQIRCRMARDAVKEEYCAHIEDQMQDFMSEGMDRKEAEKAAVKEMGDPVETGNELDRIHRPVMPWGMIALVAALSIIGFVIQMTMQGKVETAGGYGWMSISRNLFFMIIGLAVMMAVCFADYTRIARHARFLMILFDAGMLAALLIGFTINGVTNYVDIPIIGYITVEYLMLLTVPLYAAVLYAYRGQGYRALGKAVLWMLVPVVLTFRIPRFTTACILLFSFMAGPGGGRVERVVPGVEEKDLCRDTCLHFLPAGCAVRLALVFWSRVSAGTRAGDPEGSESGAGSRRLCGSGRPGVPGQQPDRRGGSR